MSEADIGHETTYLLEASPHRYGAGKIHGIREPQHDATFCGITLDRCPGSRRPGLAWEITCERCQVASEAAERRREQGARMAQHAQDRNEANQQWWAWYTNYLQSPDWKSRRTAVMERCGGMCEGCRKARATQVHHLTYDHAGQEFMFELVAVCGSCHDRLHAKAGR